MALFRIRVLPTIHDIEANTAGEATSELLAQISHHPHTILTEVIGVLTPTEVMEVSEKYDISMAPKTVRFDIKPVQGNFNWDEIPF